VVNRRASRGTVILLLPFLAIVSRTTWAGPLVLEVASSPVPYSQVVDASDGKEVSLILDREEYDPLDVTAVALIRLRTRLAPLEDLRLRLELNDADGAAVVKEELNNLGGPHLDLTLKLDAVPPGSYTLRATLIDGSGARLGEATAPLRKRVKRQQSREPDRQQLVLRVWPAEGPMEPDWPIMTGVPFPQGVLFSQDKVRLLDEGGSEVPCQTSVRSTWNRHGSIRWLGVDRARLRRQRAPRRLRSGGWRRPGL
jgi:PcRGLX-like N-terminal RIFT barrel domain